MTSRVDCGCFCCLFFFPFHPSTLIAWKSNFVVFLDFLCMDLSRSHYLSCEIIRVVSSSIFFPFFNLIFFYFYPSILSWFGIYFDFLSTGLSRYHDMGYRFDQLTRMDPIYHCLNIFKKTSFNMLLCQYFLKNIILYIYYKTC
jgi:hypothetical protein